MRFFPVVGGFTPRMSENNHEFEFSDQFPSKICI